MNRAQDVLAAADVTLDVIRRAQQEAEAAAAVAWLDEQWAELEERVRDFAQTYLGAAGDVRPGSMGYSVWIIACSPDAGYDQ